MKFDRDIIMGIVVGAIILFAWEPVGRALGWLPSPQPAAVQSSVAPAAKSEVAAKPAETAKPVAAPVPTAVKKSVKDVVPAIKPLAAQKPLEISNSDMTLTVDPLSGEVVSILLKEYLNSEKTAPLSINIAKSGSGALGISGGSKLIPAKVISASAADGIGTLSREMVSANSGKFIVIQRWNIGKSGYKTNYDVEIRNVGTEAVELSGLQIGSGMLGTWASVSGDKVRIPSHRLDYLTANGDFEEIKADKKDEKFFSGGSPLVRWSAVSNKYICLILRSGNAYPLTRVRSYVEEGGKESTPYIATGAAIPSVVLAPGAEKSFSFELYSGPKILNLIDDFDSSAGKVMHLAWGPLNYLARLLLWVLVKFHALIGNYGVSIILLTLLVRILFYPITARGNASMKKMQAVQPKIKELREKYKDNPQLMNTKMMELYRTEGVNPFGGCLPILLQIPVFFALYATLEGAVQLRQSSFLWCHDLAAADTVARVNLYFFTLSINPLVLAMTGLMVLQQHMTPMSMEPAQRKMMLLMPFVMLFFFYDLPSGLTLYWTVSNIFSIIQLRLQQRADKTTVAGAAKN